VYVLFERFVSTFFGVFAFDVMKKEQKVDLEHRVPGVGQYQLRLLVLGRSLQKRQNNRNVGLKRNKNKILAVF
jgi:hypothetical protein